MNYCRLKTTVVDSESKRNMTTIAFKVEVQIGGKTLSLPPIYTLASREALQAELERYGWQVVKIESEGQGEYGKDYQF